MENPSIAEKGGGGGSAGGGADEPTPQLFCLRWNNYQSNLTNVFDQLLQNESFVDVTLACSDGHTMKAHKVVLSACSPFFQTLLIDNPCKHPIIILNNIKWTELKAAVDFMYKGEINVCQEQIGPLLKVAESLKIRGLADVNNEQDFTSERKSPSATAAALSASVEMNRSPIRVNSSSCPNPLKRRRRASPDRGSSTNTEETLSVISSPSRALELVTSPSSSVGNGPSLPGCGITGVAGVQVSANAQNSAHSGGNRPSQSSTPQSPSNMNSSLSLPPPSAPLPGSSVADDMEIKPGIAEMIREEERAKLLESSHAAWLTPAASSIAYYQQSPKLTPMPLPLLSSDGDSNKNNNIKKNETLKKRQKTPKWTKSKLKEAMHSIMTQKFRFTQASTHYNIPKGTLYDNILGKSKRLRALDEYVLTPEEEAAILEFCCQTSVSQYNRRTRKPLTEVINFIHRLSPNRVPALNFTMSSGFRWWWAFCKKYNIVSLYYSNDLATNLPENEEPYDFSVRDTSNDNREGCMDNTSSATTGALQDYLRNFSIDSFNATFDSANDMSRFASSFSSMQATSSPICL